MIDFIIRHFEVIAGSVLLVCFTSYIAWRTWNKQRFIVASDKFRNTILMELEGLYPSPSKWPSNKFQIKRILEDKFPRIEVAVTEFRDHLSMFNRIRFDAAWLKYYKDDYYEYMPLKETGYEKGENVISIDTTDTYLNNFKHNVDDLLRFARQR